MLRSYTKSSNPPSSTLTSTHSLSAPCSPHTRRSSQKMDWTQIMIKSTCDSCSNWVIAGGKNNRSIRASKCFLRTWDFKSNSSQTRKGYLVSRRAITRRRQENALCRKSERSIGTQVDQGEAHSILCMMAETKVQNRSDQNIDHELPCLASTLVNDPCWTLDHRQELLQEKRRRFIPTIDLSIHQRNRLGGVG